MYKGKIIDTHVHIFPEKIADKATKSIADFYGIYAECGGNCNGLVQNYKGFMKELNVEKAIVHSTATTKHQVVSINDFIHSETSKNDNLIGFATFHPELTTSELDNEIKRIENMNFKGVKLHPDFQRFYVDSKEAENIYSALDGKYTIILHIGDDRYDFSHPERLLKMAKKYKNTTFIAPHFAGYKHWENAQIFTEVDNVLFDTCSALPFIDTDEAMRIIELLGEDRFMYGTDYPLWSPEKELERFMALPLDDKTRENIFYNNAVKLLNI